VIRNYPSIYNDRDAVTAPKRNGPIKSGLFGSVVAVYRLAFETEKDADTDGRIYFPVDNEEEAEELIDSLRSSGIYDYNQKRPTYKTVYFLPNGVE
jgi:hypothetical protein